jgi:NADPH-dependent 2,4-dienoyl-CoA reductase/sulfur reductase-like enzyme
MVGRQIQDLEFAKTVIEDGKADLIILGRPLLADPELPKKWAAGKPDDVRRCLRCNRCRWNELKGLPVTCTVNPALGREEEYRILAASKAKKVVVVGGGPGGMEAARVAALRGHEVLLFEKTKRLGGQLRLASVSPYKTELGKLADHLANQIYKAGVKIELGKEADGESIVKKNPDVVILAAGAKPIIPNISGVKRKIVNTAWDILGGRAATGERVIMIGGGSTGLEAAEYLAEKGKAVIILEQLAAAGLDIEPMTRMLLIQRLSGYGANLILNATVIEIADDGVVFLNNGEKRSAEAETVVLATGSMSNSQLQGLKSKAWEFYSIGDCVSPRSCMEAIQEGYWIGSQI